jgi:excisionase family DNA binding protein
MPNMVQPDEWLSLKQAAKRLGVHPGTLRRWADDGEIPVMLTPGGHRRFAEADIQNFAEQRRRLRVVSGLEQIWADHALKTARTEITTHHEQPWLSVFDEQDRENKRLLGRRLMGLILQYISLDEGGDDLVEEARAIGRVHAEKALQLGQPLADAMQAMLFFRDTMVEVAMQLPEVAHVRPETNQRLMRRINVILNAVQLAAADTFDQALKR